MATNVMSLHSERDHARLSASGAERWIACPGSVNLAAPLKAKSSNKYADRGTALHQVSELWARDGIVPKAGDIVTVRPGVTYEVTDEDIDGIWYYVDLCQSLQALAEWYAYEAPLDLTYIDPDLGGSCDFASVNEDTLHIVDLKTGRGKVVPIEGNLQMMQYALGVLQALPVKLVRKIKQVIIAIAQPFSPAASPIRHEVITLDRMIEHIIRLQDAAALTRRPDAALNPGEHCTYCAAFKDCPALKGSYMETVTTIRAIEKLTPEEMGSILTRWEYLEKWHDAIYAHAQNLAEQGIPIPGMKLVPKRASWSWPDDAIAGQELLKHFHEDDVFVTKIVTPAQARKLPVPAGFKTKKAFAEYINSISENTAAGYNLVVSGDVVKGPDLAPAVPTLALPSLDDISNKDK